MDRRKRAKHPRDCLPVGSIRIRVRKRQSGEGSTRVRVIKVRNSGPFGRRWINYARHLWEKHKGPVPDGLRVAHLDGDTLNDALDNLGLLTPADINFLAHDRDADMSRRNHEKCRAATATMNRERGMIRRATSWLPTRWYPVDLDRRVVLNEPRRQRWEAYALVGVPVTAATERWARSIALGWSGHSFNRAATLSVLAEAATLSFLADPDGTMANPAINRLRGALPVSEVLAAVNRLRARHGCRSVTRGVLYSDASVLIQQGLIIRVRRGIWMLAATALVKRGPVAGYIAMRGETLETEEFRGFERIEAAYQTGGNHEDQGPERTQQRAAVAG